MKGGATMATSLLSHLYSRIKGSQEDVATLSLQYIIAQSPALNREFTRLLCRALHGNVDGELNYVCQSVGENMERPDISGTDASGKEQILCEAKFYAGLTENQPNKYLDRLQKEGALGLVFICPDARKVTLWSKLLELCKDRATTPVDEYCVTVDGVQMTIVTWSIIIDSLRHVAASEATEALSDIHQLDGFCSLMDREAFIPFATEDFGPENAIREERHYQVVDAVFNRLLADKSLHATSKRLKAAAYRNGYVRYFFVRGHSLSLYYDRQLWSSARSEETPFWVKFKDASWKQTERYVQAFNKYPERVKELVNGEVTLALFAPANAALDEVSEAIAAQIVSYIDELDEAMK